MSTTPRIAVVTGAGRGIGAGIAKRLAAEGHSVAVVDLKEDLCADTVSAIEAAGGKAVAVGCDVADAAAVEAAVATIVEKLGPPTILVNNAGITRDAMLFKMTPDAWDAVIGVHLRGAFLLTKACQKFMTDAKWGRIVNLSSISALGNRGQANYSAAKAGVQGFTKTVAIELGKFGVTANSIAPGFIQTEMTMQMADSMKMPFEEVAAMFAKDIAVGRIGQPEDIAALVAFLVSEEAGFVSGQIIYAAGGPTN
ncbi:MAG: 3-oxoacyl-ACP reductase FabG [Dermatophilaceae bacterium]